MSTVHSVFFSPATTTRRTAGNIAAGLAGELSADKKVHDITPNASYAPVAFTADDVVLVAMPVYGGRLPLLAAERLKQFSGAGTPAVAVAVYGNRDYDDALLELKDQLTAQGFVVTAAAAFVAEHCLFPKVAASRPDAQDVQAAADFAAKAAQAVQAARSGGAVNLTVKGNVPYKERGPGGLFPTADSTCIRCGACVDVCPNGAIPDNAPNETIGQNCITCTACIKICPVTSRAIRAEMFAGMQAKFEAALGSVRKEPEFFLP